MAVFFFFSLSLDVRNLKLRVNSVSGLKQILALDDIEFGMLHALNVAHAAGPHRVAGESSGVGIVGTGALKHPLHRS